jgi:hypothetical protein
VGKTFMGLATISEKCFDPHTRDRERPDLRVLAGAGRGLAVAIALAIDAEGAGFLAERHVLALEQELPKLSTAAPKRLRLNKNLSAPTAK